jgi:hypothetical protein
MECYKKWTHASKTAHPYNKRIRPLCYATPINNPEYILCIKMTVFSVRYKVWYVLELLKEKGLK